ncbi:flagellar assembly protein FliH [Chitinibacter sp. S2-10]|uniref:flagellar assembly protein FliH n=1 Tax=Chitinibacter sp. S2-10 TaxID=3373597 RepID=UPI0039778C6A
MASNPRRIIPSEELSEFQRWQFNSLLETAARLHPEPETVEPLEEPVPDPVIEETVPGEVVFEEEPVVEAAPEPMNYPTADEIEAIQRQAHEEGYQAGLQEGRVQAQVQIQQLDQLLGEVAASCRNTETELADAVLQLALVVAQQMIGDELRQYPKQLLAPIREALAVIPTPSYPAKLFLSPADLQLLQHDLQYELAEDIWRLIPDDHLQPGSCRIETPNTQMEYSLVSRWNKILGVLSSSALPEWGAGIYPGSASVADPVDLSSMGSDVNLVDPTIAQVSSSKPPANDTDA